MRRITLALLCLLATLAGAPAPAAQDCDRACLYAVLDGYLAALKAKDPARVPWAPLARYVENNVLLPRDDGLWGTLTALGDYDLRFADVAAGQVAFFGVVEESVSKSPFALRLEIRRGQVVEAEALVSRPMDAGVPFVTGELRRRPELYEPLAAAERGPRTTLVKVADGYFDTLQRNDGTLRTAFEDGCNRIENGMQTTNNHDPRYPKFAYGCAEQFRLGMYRYDDALRARRYPVVDEERGFVLGTGFIDHSGRLGQFRWTDGTPAESSYRRPHSFYYLEAFRIRAGKIQAIESVFTTVPYRMPRAAEGASPRH